MNPLFPKNGKCPPVFPLILLLLLLLSVSSCQKENADSTPSSAAPIPSGSPAPSEQAEETLAPLDPPETSSFGEPPAMPLVTVTVDGTPVEPHHELLYAIHGGVVHDGAAIFESTPRKSIVNELPVFPMKKGMKITVNGEEKTSVIVSDFDTMTRRDGSFETENLAEILGKGRFIVTFDAKSIGTGQNANDCRVETYDMIVEIG